MEKILLPGCLILSSCYIAFGQNELCTLNFDTPNDYCDSVLIDIAQNPDNIWQIGSPHKQVFNLGYSSDNAIVTDTLNSYPMNDTSSFIRYHIADLGYAWPRWLLLRDIIG